MREFGGVGVAGEGRRDSEKESGRREEAVGEARKDNTRGRRDVRGEWEAGWREWGREREMKGIG